MRDNQQAISAGPTTTTIFSAAAAGRRARTVLVTCAHDSTNPIEYRIDDPEDTPGEWALLQPGDAVRLGPFAQDIGTITARGVGGAGSGGVEVLSS